MEIDGVFSGGGIKGLALIGALDVLEERGFKFKRLAGASVGSIFAGFLAAGYTAKEIESLLYETDLKDFLDTRKTMLPVPIAKWLLLYWRLGLYRGARFEEWLEKKLAEKGVFTFKDLPKGSLYFVASDLSNNRLVVLPDDLGDYGIPSETFPVARAIRMSCSIPYFFEPVKLRSLDGTSVIVDGGVLSNFPMWLFVKRGERRERPVLGITLSQNKLEQPKAKIKNAVQLFDALFTTMKDAHDARYISRKLEKDIIFIPGEGILPIDFHLTDEKKAALIEAGRKKTKTFLKTWTY
ncbi:patatin-like phospholipase family protein [Heyndrickxia acidiproducens]|uniref:patatin-like phospholipase family protein n=1 Tax=Heyndrickxia acidiproducens TaxID=1121084 RepID=UPI00036D85C8|nr:patatin-like phospholipase family protein [Heyndrickxia acidiproducens]